MIIYRIRESGQAADFQFARKCPDGWKSIELSNDIRKIEDVDINLLHEQKYIDNQALENQKQILLNLIINNEYHLISRRFVADKAEWETALDNWAEQLEETELIEIYPKPF